VNPLLTIVRKELLEMRRTRRFLLRFFIAPSFVLLYSFTALGNLPHRSHGEVGALTASRLSSEDIEAAEWFGRSKIFLLLMLPMLFSAALVMQTMVVEKTAKTLEPLLVTPVKTYDLVLGKILAALVFPLLAGYLYLAIYVGVVCLMDRHSEMLRFMFSPRPLIEAFLVMPVSAFANASLAMIVAVRSRDPKTGSLLSSLLTLPGIVLYGTQIALLDFLNQYILLVCVGAVLLLAGAGIFFATEAFQREKVFERWDS
jgi:ABC-2 type transport system permease protein